MQDFLPQIFLLTRNFAVRNNYKKFFLFFSPEVSLGVFKWIPSEILPVPLSTISADISKNIPSEILQRISQGIHLEMSQAIGIFLLFISKGIISSF